jgi:hypothetical protein
MGSLSLSLRSLAQPNEEADGTKDPADSLLRFAAASAAEAKKPEEMKESFTLDRELLFMRRKAAGGGARKVVIVRGDKSETAKF